jgi:hypothetical protein
VAVVYEVDTVLADLLTPAEEQLGARTGLLRFDIDLLATQVTAWGDWMVAYRPGLACGQGSSARAPVPPSRLSRQRADPAQVADARLRPRPQIIF